MARKHLQTGLARSSGLLDHLLCDQHGVSLWPQPRTKRVSNKKLLEKISGVVVPTLNHIYWIWNIIIFEFIYVPFNSRKCWWAL